MGWTIEEMSLGFRVLEFLMVSALSFYVYISNKDKATNARIDAMEKRLDDKLDGHVERITKLEGGPTHGHLDEVHERITDVAVNISTLSGEMLGMKTVLNLIHEHLLNGKNK